MSGGVSGGLDGEPFVDDETVVAPGGVEVGERRLGLAVGDEEGERGHALGHVVGGGELFAGEGGRRVGGGQERQRPAAQRAVAGGGGIGAVGAGDGVLGVETRGLRRRARAIAASRARRARQMARGSGARRPRRGGR